MTQPDHQYPGAVDRHRPLAVPEADRLLRSPSGRDELSRRMAERIEKEAGTPPVWRTVLKRSLALVVTGVAVYLVLPSLTAVFDSWPRLSTLAPLWLLAALAAETTHFACTFTLQRLALRTRAWFPVVTAQLAGNAISLVVPGGTAAGAALQFRMLESTGTDSEGTVGGLTAFSLLGIAGLLALPVLALPAIAFGAPVRAGLAETAYVGLVAFVLFTGFGVWVLLGDRPLRAAGRAVEGLHNRLLRRRDPIEGLAARLLCERDRIRDVLGRRWKQALLLSTGRLAFDYMALLFALRAVGSRPSPSLVLLAYAAAGIIGLFPITPGGLGIVEASMSGFLILAGVPAGRAVLATLTYRLVSYWIPMAAGPVAYLAFRRRYGPPTSRSHHEAAAGG